MRKIGNKNLGQYLLVEELETKSVKTENNKVVYRNTKCSVDLCVTRHRELAKLVVEKIIEVINLGQKEIEVSELYDIVEKTNEKHYLLKRGCVVIIEGKEYTKAIYQNKDGYFYKDLTSKEWVEVKHIQDYTFEA